MAFEVECDQRGLGKILDPLVPWFFAGIDNVLWDLFSSATSSRNCVLRRHDRIPLRQVDGFQRFNRGPWCLNFFLVIHAQEFDLAELNFVLSSSVSHHELDLLGKKSESQVAPDSTPSASPLQVTHRGNLLFPAFHWNEDVYGHRISVWEVIG